MADVRPREMVLSRERLESWGARIGREAGLPLVVALRGALGAGKSTLARAIARGAGVEGSVPSPTFNLLLAHRGARGMVQHLDLYRLAQPDEVWELGWEELGRGDEIVIIEWPDRAESLLPPDRWEVHLVEEDDPGLRRVTVVPAGRPPFLPGLSEPLR